jgi:hypothetical protein
MIMALTCVNVVAGAGFEPATSGRPKPRRRPSHVAQETLGNPLILEVAPQLTDPDSTRRSWASHGCLWPLCVDVHSPFKSEPPVPDPTSVRRLLHAASGIRGQSVNAFTG